MSKSIGSGMKCTGRNYCTQYDAFGTAECIGCEYNESIDKPKKARKISIGMGLLREKKVKIRKEQICTFCYRKFPKGTVMRFQVYVFDGALDNCYSCSVCDEILNSGKLKPERGYDFECYTEGAVNETMNANNCKTPEELLAKIKRGEEIDTY
jgi:hypothetical protein